MKPRSKSVWMTPAACGAVHPLRIVQARAHGRVRMEGKDYVMADGDVVEFRFNV